MVKRSENILHGMKSICAYYGRSEATIKKYRDEFGMPIRNINGIWTSDRVLIDDWHKDFIAARTDRWLPRDVL